MRSLAQLIEAIHQEARRASFPIDAPIYEKVGKDPWQPVLFAGALEAPACVFGRDLGKDEVAEGQPLIGAGGRLVRSGFYQAKHGQAPPKSDRKLESVLSDVLLTNTVPYKPPGNKAYSSAVKERFRPYVAELLACHWTGRHVVTLGTEAFQWFRPYAEPEAFDAFWDREDRYEAEYTCTLTLGQSPQSIHKPISLLPLPHPSPLNARWYKRFPELLAQRLDQLGRETADDAKNG